MGKTTFTAPPIRQAAVYSREFAIEVVFRFLESSPRVLKILTEITSKDADFYIEMLIWAFRYNQLRWNCWKKFWKEIDRDEGLRQTLRDKTIPRLERLKYLKCVKYYTADLHLDTLDHSNFAQNET